MIADSVEPVGAAQVMVRKSAPGVSVPMVGAPDAPAQLVPAQEQFLQVGEAAQFGRYLPAQLVAVEVQPLQVGETAQLRRYLAGQLVVGEIQIFQLGQDEAALTSHWCST